MQERLQKILAQATKLSRRSAEEAIENGEVRVNGIVVTKLGTKADPDKDRIYYAGKTVKPVRQKLYILFNKPKNTIVSKSDPEGRPTIWDRLNKDMREILNSAGRLDFDSEGLLILSNDGKLIFKLTHPSCEIWKTYYVKVSGQIEKEKLEQLKNGIKLEDGITAPAKIAFLRSSDRNSFYEIAIKEGKNRQIRRMFTAIGHPVSKLRRISIGSLKLGSLKVGEWRYLNRREFGYINSLLSK